MRPSCALLAAAAGLHPLPPRTSCRGLVLCAKGSPAAIGPAAAARLLEKTGDATLLDVRLEGEYRLDGHVADSVNVPAFTWEHGFYLPSTVFEAEVAAAEGCSRGTQLIIACTDGSRAPEAARRLVAAGWSRCAVLDGGLKAWEESGLELELDDDGEGGLVGAWV